MVSTALQLASGLAPVLTQPVYPALVEVLVPVSRGTADQAAQALQGLLPGLIDASVAARLGTLSDRVDRAIDPDELALAQRDGTSTLARVLASIANQGLRPRTLEDYLVSLSPRLSSWIGTNDNPTTATAQLLKAIAYCQARGQALVIDGGRKFILNARITSSGSLAVIGEQGDTSTLCWVSGSSNGGGWEHTNVNVGYTTRFTMKDVRLTTLGTGVGKALHVVASGTTAQDRISTTCILSNVSIRGENGPRDTGWRDGIHCDGTVAAVIENPNIMGYLQGQIPSAGYGISFSNDIGASPHPAAAHISRPFIQAFSIGIRAYDFEACYITNHHIQNCPIGVDFDGPDIYPQADLHDGHILATSICVRVSRMQEIKVIGNTLLLQQINTQNTTGRAYHVKYVNGAGKGTNSGNTFEVYDGSSAVTNIYVETGDNLQIGPNVHRSSNSNPGLNPDGPGASKDATGVGVHLGAGATACRVLPGNVFVAGSYAQTIRDEGVGSVLGISPEENTNSFIAWMNTLPVWAGGDAPAPVPTGRPYLLGPGGPVVIAQ